MEKVLKIPIAFKSYVSLTKPGIIIGNLLVAAGAFALGAKGAVLIPVLCTALLGLGLMIASACTFNNIIDRHHDAKMARTRTRPLACGTLSVRSAAFFGILLLLFGTYILSAGAPLLTVSLALVGFFFYVVVYSFSKYHTSYGTLIGTISGSIPLIVGYTAASGALDLCAFFLFLIMTLWQIPHFFAIALFRLNDYTKASIPVFPRIKGIRKAKVHMIFYLFAFIASTILPTLYGYTSIAFACILGSLGVAWLLLSFQGFSTKNNELWARKMFFFSLIVVIAFSLLLILTLVSS